MLCEALGRKLTAEEQFAALALTGDPSLLATEPKEHLASSKSHIFVFLIYVEMVVEI